MGDEKAKIRACTLFIMVPRKNDGTATSYDPEKSVRPSVEVQATVGPRPAWYVHHFLSLVLLIRSFFWGCDANAIGTAFDFVSVSLLT